LLGVRLLVFVVLCVVLMVVDARFDALKTVRSQMGLVLTPFYWVGRHAGADLERCDRADRQ